MYQFLFQSKPSPNTIQRIIDGVQIERDRLKKEHGYTDSYWMGQIDGLTDIIKALEDLKEEMKYIDMRNLPRL